MFFAPDEKRPLQTVVGLRHFNCVECTVRSGSLSLCFCFLSCDKLAQYKLYANDLLPLPISLYIQWFGFAKDRTRHCFEWKGSPLTGPVLRQSKITTRFWWFVSSLQRRCFVSLADWEKEGFRGPTSSRIAPILAPSIVPEAPGILRLSSLSK